MTDFIAAIFDLDGTLIDSFSAWKGSARKALAAINHTLVDREFDNLYLMTTEETNDYFYKIYESNRCAFGDSIPFDSVMDIVVSEMERQYECGIAALPFALEYVKTLHNRGIPVCVATLTPNDLAEKALAGIGFLPFLKFVITGDDVGRSKKFPDIFLAAAERLGAAPPETVVFEDSPTAIITAHKAGFIVCRVVDAHQNYADDISQHCDWSIKSFRELM